MEAQPLGRDENHIDIDFLDGSSPRISGIAMSLSRSLLSMPQLTCYHKTSQFPKKILIR